MLKKRPKRRSNLPLDPISHGSAPQWSLESWLFRRLEKFDGVRFGEFTAGVTSTRDRAERARKKINELRLGSKRIGLKVKTGRDVLGFLSAYLSLRATRFAGEPTCSN